MKSFFILAFFVCNVLSLSIESFSNVPIVCGHSIFDFDYNCRIKTVVSSIVELGRNTTHSDKKDIPCNLGITDELSFKEIKGTLGNYFWNVESFYRKDPHRTMYRGSNIQLKPYAISNYINIEKMDESFEDSSGFLLDLEVLFQCRIPDEKILVNFGSPVFQSDGHFLQVKMQARDHPWNAVIKMFGAVFVDNVTQSLQYYQIFKDQRSFRISVEYPPCKDKMEHFMIFTLEERDPQDTYDTDHQIYSSFSWGPFLPYIYVLYKITFVVTILFWIYYGVLAIMMLYFETQLYTQGVDRITDHRYY